MTTETFIACKADFLVTYNKVLCEESLEAVQDAETPEQFIRLLHEFATFLRYKAIPTAEWCRKWFGKEKELANSCGVYLDQILFLKDPAERSLVLIGKCNLQIMYTESRRNTLVLQDESVAGLLLYNAAYCTVREKGSGKASIIMCNRPAMVKIHRI